MRSIFLRLVMEVLFMAILGSISVAQNTPSRFEYQISVSFITADIIDNTYRSARMILRSYPTG